MAAALEAPRGLVNATGDRVDVICDNGEGGGTKNVVVRAALSRSLAPWSPVAEAALSAVESALCYGGLPGDENDAVALSDCSGARLALLLRSDCARLARAVSNDGHDDGDDSGPLVEDPGWAATAAILSDLFEMALSKLSGNDGDSGEHQAGSMCEEEHKNEDDGALSGSAWDELLQSDFHTKYALGEGRCLLLERAQHGDHIDHSLPTRHASRRENGRRSRGSEVARLDPDETVPSSVQFFLCVVSEDEKGYGEGLPSKGSKEVGETESTIISSSNVAQAIFDSLHLLYEDSKLSRNTRGTTWIRPLGALLVRLCTKVGIANSLSSSGVGGVFVMGDFIDHYHRDLGHAYLQDHCPLEDANGSERSSIAMAAAAESVRSSISTFTAPPCFFSWMDGLMNGYYYSGAEDEEEGGESFIDKGQFYARMARNELNGVCSLTRVVHRFFSILFDDEERAAGGSVHGHTGSSREDEMEIDTPMDEEAWKESDCATDRNLVLAMIDEGLCQPSVLLDEFPTAVALPLMEALHRCRSDPPLDPLPDGVKWPNSAYSLINRSDIVETRRKKVSDRDPVSSEGVSAIASGHRSHPHGRDDPDRDGLVPLEHLSSMLFPEDDRVREAVRLLRSSRPIFLRVPRAPEVSDHDYERLKQERLLLLCRRVLAFPLGRGMSTIGTLPPETVTRAAEPLPMPDLCLQGRVPPTNATLALDVSGCPVDMSLWPEFHNGVAAGLRLPLAGDGLKNKKNDGLRQITRTWIVYNKPASASVSASSQNRQGGNNAGDGAVDGNDRPNHAHGGFLMALGLRGHLAALSMPDIYDYLTQGAVTTTVGILLGMAANKRGTCDPSVSKMLCLHLPSLLPASFASMDVASTAQSAAVAGIGLLYQKSSHRLMTEFLLNELGKKPSSDQNTHDRQGYTLSCGLALGMVNLSSGRSLETSHKREAEEAIDGHGLSDLRIEERLHRYIVGGIDDIDLRQRREAAERAAASGNPTPAEQERCSCIHEGESINIDVTAPGSILALGLMYLQTENKSVCETSLSLPDTLFLLDTVRPDLLMLRVIARALILWESVKPTKEWIDNQIPSIVALCFEQMGQKVAGYGGMADIDAIQVDADSSSEKQNESNGGVEGLSENAEGNGQAVVMQDGTDRTQTKADEGRTHNDATAAGPTGVADDLDFDRQALRQAHAHIVAGACFGMGLRYAGTGNLDAASTLHNQVHAFLRLREDSDLISAVQRPEKPITEMCLACSALALAMVMAGTGDLKTLTLLRALRWSCDENVRYGTHMTFAAAIGLLFLGGGTCTLGREPEDIAALLLAFFPRFPSISSDNQYHLQALRHFYALAVKKRNIEAIDIDTQEKVVVPIEVSCNQKEKGKFLETEAEVIKMTAPCLLLNKGKMSMLRLDSNRYYPVSLDLQSAGLVLFVKKKYGHLSYQQDPHAQRSLAVQTGGTGGGSGLDLIQAFTEDPMLLAYAKHLCQTAMGQVNASKWVIVQNREALISRVSTEKFCTEILHECLTLDKPEALPLYLSLRNSLIAIEDVMSDSMGVWDMRLVRSYYQARQHLGNPSPSSVPLLGLEYVILFEEYLGRLFDRRDVQEVLMNYVSSCGSWARGRDWPGLFGSFLIWHQTPFPSSDMGL
uniref:Anaphase-promoting complex subunit 1 C-terminal domain-containing protein n=1 Tax=Odontella aurita TaxID=265563 RepID=A0A7S4MEE8_9STRA